MESECPSRKECELARPSGVELDVFMKGVYSL